MGSRRRRSIRTVTAFIHTPPTDEWAVVRRDCTRLYDPYDPEVLSDDEESVPYLCSVSAEYCRKRDRCHAEISWDAESRMLTHGPIFCLSVFHFYSTVSAFIISLIIFMSGIRQCDAAGP